MTTGWQCPVCGGGVAPGVERCPCVAVGKQAMPLSGDSPINIPEFLRPSVTPDDGWIEWKGVGLCPLPMDTRFAYLIRSGTKCTATGNAPYMRWNWLSMVPQYDDIVAYKVLP